MSHSLLLLCLAAALQPATPTTPTTPTAPPAPKPQPASTTPPNLGERPVAISTEGDLFDSAEAVVVATGLKFAEGPLYRPDGSLIICDLQGDAVFSIPAVDGKANLSPGKGVDTLRSPSGRAAGAALDPQGRLLFTQFDGTLTRLDKAAETTTLASEFDGKKFNMLNDLAVAPDGSVFFSDFGAGKDDHLPHAGVYRFGPDGKLSAVAKDIAAPNGVALSHDAKTLFVALYRDAKIMAYDLADGAASNARVFAEIKDEAIKGRSAPDGLKVDAAGNVWTTGAGGVWVLSPQGKRIGRVLVPMAANLCFGGADGKTVFIAAGPRVVSVRLKNPAVPAPTKSAPAKTAEPKTAEPKAADPKPAAR